MSDSTCLSTHCLEGIPTGDLKDVDADIPTAVGTEKHRECFQVITRQMSIDMTLAYIQKNTGGQPKIITFCTGFVAG